MRAGKRNTLITIERATVTKDDHGGAIETWATYATVLAEVKFGSGEERREAAQESATQSATFGLLADPLTRLITPKDRVSGYLSADWDIVSVALPWRDEVQITAVRKAA